MQAFDMTKIERNSRKRGVLTVFLLSAAVLLAGSVELVAMADENGFMAGGIPTVVIDPGHGGYDHGGQGPAGTIEKTVTLNFAQILAKELKPDYNVVLTRNGDYQVALTRRSSVANHQGADLFISLHTGGGNRHQMNTWSVFYYQKTDQHDIGLNPKPAGSGDSESNAEKGQLEWDHIQLRHQKKSRTLAGCLKNQLAENPEILETSLTGAALRVLQGLDMPAVIIETGYLTNPTTEKQLNETGFLTDVAKNIKKGIDVYLTR